MTRNWIVGMAAMLGLLVCVLAARSAGPAAAVETGLKVMVGMPDGHVWVIDNEHSYLNVILENTGERSISLHDLENSWGWSNVRLEWESDGMHGVVEHAARGWRANQENVTELASGEARVRTVSLESEWKGWPELKNGMKLTIRAVYESKEGAKAWLGREASKDVVVTVRDRRK